MLAAARRRIERASGLRHRPLQALGDRPSGALDAAAAALWQAHLRRMEAAHPPVAGRALRGLDLRRAIHGDCAPCWPSCC